MNTTPDSIIFDLDGTLWNATEQLSKIWSSVVSKYPEIKREITVTELESVMGKTLEEIGEKFFPRQTKEMQKKIVLECCEKQCPILEKDGGKLYPLVPETLKYLSKKYGLFIVSNCQNGYIPAFLKAHNLKEYFTDFECPGATGLSKGENINLIIKRNNLKSPVYVGDTNGDFLSAKFAKIPFVFASYGFGKVSSPNYTIKTFSDLQKIF